MNNASFGVVKSGWLQRRTNILHKWEKKWVTLGTDGLLRYFDNENSSHANDAARMKVDCLRIRAGNDIVDVSSPPAGCGRISLFSVEFRNKTWNFCAESPDDMEAWRLALEESRSLTAPGAVAAPPAYNPGAAPPLYQSGPPPPYVPQGPYQQTTTTTVYNQRPYPTQGPAVAYPGQVYYGSNPPPQIVQNPQNLQNPGNTTIIVQDGNNQRGMNGGDAAMGFVAGAAVGSMMWGPMLWW